jgi:hypothetical protein
MEDLKIALRGIAVSIAMIILTAIFIPARLIEVLSSAISALVIEAMNELAKVIPQESGRFRPVSASGIKSAVLPSPFRRKWV